MGIVRFLKIKSYNLILIEIFHVLCSEKKDVLNLGEHVLVNKIHGYITKISNRFYILAVELLELRMVCTSITPCWSYGIITSFY